VAYGTYQSINSSDPTDIIVVQNRTALSYGYTSSPSPIQAGGLVSFASDVVLARFGVSFISTDQACANAEEEIPDWDWDAVQGASQSKWEDVLSRVIIDTEKENATIVELLYSSVC
jgi:putative alpha-1,2-mannosidase